VFSGLTLRRCSGRPCPLLRSHACTTRAVRCEAAWSSSVEIYGQMKSSEVWRCLPRGVWSRGHKSTAFVMRRDRRGNDTTVCHPRFVTYCSSSADPSTTSSYPPTPAPYPTPIPTSPDLPNATTSTRIASLSQAAYPTPASAPAPAEWAPSA